MTSTKYKKIGHMFLCKKWSYCIAVVCVLFWGYYTFTEDFTRIYYDLDHYDLEYIGNGCSYNLLFLVDAVLWYIEGRCLCDRYFRRLYDITDEDIREFEEEPMPFD